VIALRDVGARGSPFSTRAAECKGARNHRFDHRSPHEEQPPMADVLYLGLAALLFAASGAYVRCTQALIGRSDTASASGGEEQR
jgi:hypothetical protein